jgi:saccharopine dehydrogenase-like NADP-dependent oxidoreductase
MKHILLFGAGKSATVLIEYLKDLSMEHQYYVTVADGNLENAQLKTGEHPFVKAVEANVEKLEERKCLIQVADVVISLLPPALHYLVASDCIEYNKHLLTASYIDEKIQALKPEIENKNLLFLCEMGLDPGIDHMSAVQLIRRIKALGGTITSFKSHCGGLVAPESDDNPWHYKISWNPRNIVNAGKAGATFKENGTEKHLNYHELFAAGQLVKINDELLLSYYPNRDSIGYMSLYDVEEAKTFVRTTLRHPDFCFGWKNIIELKLTDEEVMYYSNGLSLADFFKLHFDKYGFNEWLNEMLSTRLSVAKEIMENLVQLIETENELGLETKDETIMLVNEAGELNTVEVDEVKGKAAGTLAVKMHEATLILKQLFFLGLDSDEIINLGKCSAADILQFILEKRMKLQENDKDMVVMLHEIVYEVDGVKNSVSSSMVIKGENNRHTAMAKTVGLPLGIAAKFILDGTIKATGLQIPILQEIYEPVLKELEKHGITFTEKID